jgi:hypothetical protein
LTEILGHLWTHVLALGDRYGVDPFVFGVLYLAHHPLFWGTMAWLAACVRQKRPVIVPIILGVFFWLLPYGYVFLFGHGLPWWAWGLAVLFLVVGGTHVIREIRRRLIFRRMAGDADPIPPSH